MALSILNSLLLADGQDPRFAPVIASPLPGVWYDLDVAWGPASSDAPAAFSTAASASGGATFDTAYGMANYGHQVSSSGRTGIDQGWSPNGKLVWLGPTQCALALWRIQFPAAGSYTITLSGVGAIPVTASGSAPVVTSPAIVVLHPRPLNRQASRLLQLSFTGTYPAGGLDLSPGQIGLAAVLFADVQDTAAYRFSWSASKLRLWTGAGEASGAVTFTTQALFL